MNLADPLLFIKSEFTGVFGVPECEVTTGQVQIKELKNLFNLI